MPTAKKQNNKPKPLRKARAPRARVPITICDPYEPSAPVAMATSRPQVGMRSSPPSRDATARFEGVDYIDSIDSSSSNATIGLYQDIRALNATMFPRLSAIADVFLRYRLRKLRFHLIGKSASTQAGVIGFGSVIDDLQGSVVTITTDEQVKNTEGCLVIKGWENGSHEVKVSSGGVKWYTTDTQGIPDGYGAVFISVPQTTAAADLSWDLYVEYDVEFSESLAGSSVSGMMREREKAKIDPIAATKAQIEVLQQQLETLKSTTQTPRV